MTIYCTYVTFYSGNKLPPFYIGSTYSDRVLKKNYHGSVKSKKWQSIYNQELKENQHLFKTEIIDTFETRKEAIAYELELQKANDVVKSKWFFNEALACVNGCFGSDRSGYKHNEETKEKISKSVKQNHHMVGKHHTEEHKLKLSLKTKGRPGKPNSVETREKLRLSQLNKPVLTCPHCGKVGKGSRMISNHFDRCKTLVFQF